MRNSPGDNGVRGARTTARVALVCAILCFGGSVVLAQSERTPPAGRGWFVDGGFIWAIDRTTGQDRPPPPGPPSRYEDTGPDRPGGRGQVGVAVGPRSTIRFAVDSAVPHRTSAYSRLSAGEAAGHWRARVTTATALAGFSPAFARKWRLGLLLGGGAARRVTSTTSIGPSRIVPANESQRRVHPILSVGIESGIRLHGRVSVVPQAALHLLFGTNAPVSFRPGIAMRIDLSPSTGRRSDVMEHVNR